MVSGMMFPVVSDGMLASLKVGLDCFLGDLLPVDVYGWLSDGFRLNCLLMVAGGSSYSSIYSFTLMEIMVS